jgi:D-beta-D-heptose 7-phosphate kinase/D-beta-D-heptose 1-phosphate adenosyltransferase
MAASATRIRELLKAFGRQRILVVGDLMLDRYLYGEVERISPEAPVPIVKVGRERRMAGGAANVAANIRALGGAAVLAGAVGDDAAGSDLRATLRRNGIELQGVLTVPDMATTVKMRVIADRQQVVRVDWENQPALGGRVRRAMAQRLRDLIPGVTGVILADYGKGVLEQDTADAALRAARRRGIPIGMDPKDTHALRIAGLTLATPNCREAHVCAGLPARAAIPGDPAKDKLLRRAAAILLRKWRTDQLLITLGAQGMYLAAPRQQPEVIPTRAREVFDVSGAGDTVIATCLLALAAGATQREAALLGNIAAGVVVGKLGTACCSPAELLAAVEPGG